MKTGALILAAGKGTRMHSNTPKVLQTLLGEPMLAYVATALRPVFGENVWAVIGHGAEQVRAAFSNNALHFVEQPEQLGTGHALMMAQPTLEAAGIERVLVVNGDMPLLTQGMVRHLLREAGTADVAVATLTLQNPGAYGRIVRTAGRVTAIVEAKDYNEAVHGKPSGEINAGVYVVRMDVVRRFLPKLSCANAGGEYYITDLLGLAVAENLHVVGMDCAQEFDLLGVNSPVELADSEERLRHRLVRGLLESGVMIHAPNTARIGPFVHVEPGAELFGPCEILGHTRLAKGCKIEAFCHLHNAHVESGAVVRHYCHIEDAHIGPQCTVGPFARLRPGADLEEQAHVGNFVELKKTRLGRGAKANHLSYIGDADVGAGTNIGAGTITCNYDGKNKFRTIIGERAFIGSNTSLVAPVAIGENALVGAGSVITKDVPDGQLAVARGKQCNLIKRK